MAVECFYSKNSISNIPLERYLNSNPVEYSNTPSKKNRLCCHFCQMSEKKFQKEFLLELERCSFCFSIMNRREDRVSLGPDGDLQFEPGSVLFPSMEFYQAARIVASRTCIREVEGVRRITNEYRVRWQPTMFDGARYQFPDSWEFAIDIHGQAMFTQDLLDAFYER